MSTPHGPQNQESIKKFNKLVGNRTGRPVKYQAGAAKNAKVRATTKTPAFREAVGQLIQHGGGKVPASVRNQQKAWFGEGSASDPYTGTVNAFEKVYDNLSQELNNQVREENAVRTAYAAQVLDKQVDPNKPTNEFGLEFQPSIDEQYLGGNVQKHVIGPLARAGSVIPNALIANVQAGYKARDEGAGYWEQTLEGLKAGKSSVAKDIKDIPTGSNEETQQHGPGDIYEAVKQGGETPVSVAARWLEREHPSIEQNVIARPAGALGEWYLHPLGRVIGGGKVGVIGGERATEEAIEAHVRNVADAWAADAHTNLIPGLNKAPGGYATHPSEAAMADSFFNETMQRIKAGTLQVSAGGSAGRLEILSPRHTAGIVAAHGSQSLQDSFTVLFRDRVNRMIDGIEGRGPKLNGSALDQWAANNPDFTEFLDDVMDHHIQQGNIPTNASRDALANHLSQGDVTDLRNFEQGVIDRHYTPYVQEAADQIARDFRKNYYHAPGIRVGKTVYPVKALGHAYAALGGKFLDGVGKNFRYNSVFPGSLSLDTTRARAWGVRASEEFEQQVREKAKPFSKADGIEIQHAIENNKVHLLPMEQQTVANWIRDQYKQMYMDEFNFGARGRAKYTKPGMDSSSTPYDPNYAFVHNKGGTIEDRRDWKGDQNSGRKGTIHENVRKKNGQGAGRYKTANAKEQGFRPVENAFEALSHRRIKHNRDMVRSTFLNDMVDKYGIVSRINPSGKGYAAEARGLEKVSFSRLPEHLRIQLETTGEDMYMPKEMARMINQFDEITKWHSGMQGRIGRSFAEVMRIIKKGMTLPWPGFHNKNMIGDIFMGLLDHILPKDYALVIQKGLASLGGRDSLFKVLKHDSGLDLTFREFWHKYQDEANSGFISSELGTLGSSASAAKWNVPKKVAGRAESIALNASGFREDAGRFTHYVTAYKQEARELWKQGERDLAKIEQKASSAALWRVNNYKFDYNALMLWEKKAKTLYFPFYTFMRKAAPTLFQALYQDPRWINAWTRYMYQNQLPDGQESAGGFDGFRVPQDIRDSGFAFIGGQEDEPQYVSNDILPTSVFNSIKTKNAHEFFNSIMSQSALPFQVAIEQATGKELYLDRPLKDKSFGEYLFSKIPGVREVGGAINSDKSLIDQAISSRLGAGLPIRNLNESQQLFAEQEWQDRLIDDPLHKVNYSQDLYYISRQVAPDGKAEIFSVKNNQLLDSQGNATVVASYYTPEDAIQYVKKNLPDGYKKIPTTMDVDNQGNPIRRPVGG